MQQRSDAQDTTPMPSSVNAEWLLRKSGRVAVYQLDRPLPCARANVRTDQNC